MKHLVKNKRIGVNSKHKKAVLRNLAVQLLKYERIQTTILKAKLLRSFVEKIITRSKQDSLHNRRIVYKNIRDKEVLKKLFTEIGKRYLTRKGGYTRIIKYKKRQGDGAELCYIELMPELLEVESVNKSDNAEKVKDTEKELKQDKVQAEASDKVDESDKNTEAVENKIDNVSENKVENNQTNEETEDNKN